ncbi:MAG TPA: aspartyl protease family protein, partial [Pyrinomonadaceae bacterium]|nr:aspartyl protease family protein [Pyrinomonadaceae bacterium]
GTRAVSFGTALSVAGDIKNLDKVAANVAPAIIVPRPVTFRDVPGRGLLLRTWVNSAGPFSFAIDTGAGATLLSPRVASEAQVTIKRGRGNPIAGLSGAPGSTQDATVRSIAIGDSENYLPAKGDVVVTRGLPSDLDGVLDPTEAFAPLGYVIDIPRRELSGFDPHALPLRLDEQPADGAVVQWLREGHSRRPFVQLDNGDRALLDTGSNLALAIRDRDDESNNQRVSGSVIRDVGGGNVSARRARPTNVAIGSLTLRNIPTDVISGAEANAPVLLGLSALRPFRLRFDPVHHLIEIAPGVSQYHLR